MINQTSWDSWRLKKDSSILNQSTNSIGCIKWYSSCVQFFLCSVFLPAKFSLDEVRKFSLRIYAKFGIKIAEKKQIEQSTNKCFSKFLDPINERLSKKLMSTLESFLYNANMQWEFCILNYTETNIKLNYMTLTLISPFFFISFFPFFFLLRLFFFFFFFLAFQIPHCCKCTGQPSCSKQFPP